MEYTINKLASLAGVSTRTLRYYDEIGLLTPCRVNSSGYRIYGETEVNTLQDIMFYRELGMELEKIKGLLQDTSYNRKITLYEHYHKLLEKRNQIDQLLKTVEKTMLTMEGKSIMSDKEKFEGFKKKLIEDNEKQYGKEARAKYGDEQVDATNKKLGQMTEENYNQLEVLTKTLHETLKEACEEGNPQSELAQKACALHKEWLMYYWTQYSKEAHLGLVQMYTEDERFTKYYEAIAPGSAVFLKKAMESYLK